MGLFDKKQKKEEKEEEFSDSERIDRGQLFARIIIELFGKPKKHVENSLKTYVDKIKTDLDIKIKKEDYSKTKKQGELFSVFVELELWFNSVSKLIEFCFDYMPSSVEIIKPEKFYYQSNEFAGILNDLQAKLHHLDMIVKNLTTENLNLKNNAGNLIRNIITLSLKSKTKTIEELSTDVGVPAEDLDKLLKILLKERRILQKKDKYGLPGK